MNKSEYTQIEKIADTHFWYRAFDTFTLRLIEKFELKIGKILDAGCGNGIFTKKLQRFGEVFAVDVNTIAIKMAQKRIRNVRKASICHLPYNDNMFDIAVCLDVLYHKSVEDDGMALRELFRVLKPGGRLLVRVPAFEFLRGHHDVVVQTRHRYTAPELGEKIERAGFTLQKVSYANMFLSLPLFFKRLLERKHILVSDTSDTIPLPSLLNESLYHLLSFENNLLKFISLPFGSSVLCIAQKPIAKQTFTTYPKWFDIKIDAESKRYQSRNSFLQISRNIKRNRN